MLKNYRFSARPGVSDPDPWTPLHGDTRRGANRSSYNEIPREYMPKKEGRHPLDVKAAREERRRKRNTPLARAVRVAVPLGLFGAGIYATHRIGKGTAEVGERIIKETSENSSLYRQILDLEHKKAVAGLDANLSALERAIATGEKALETPKGNVMGTGHQQGLYSQARRNPYATEDMKKAVPETQADVSHPMEPFTARHYTKVYKHHERPQYAIILNELLGGTYVI